MWSFFVKTRGNHGKIYSTVFQKEFDMLRTYVCITGDLFHHGHIAFFKRAKEYGEYLIVGICADNDVEIYKRRPIMSLSERVAVIETCNLVNEVIRGAPPETTKRFIERYKIDVVVSTKTFSQTTLDKYFKDPQEMGILKLVDYEEGISSTDIIKRCASFFIKNKGSLGKL